MKKSNYVNLIYPSSGEYWLASSCVDARFNSSYAHFYVRYVNYSLVDAGSLFRSFGMEGSGSLAVRPVVSLTSKIQKNSTTGSVTWEFVS